MKIEIDSERHFEMALDIYIRYLHRLTAVSHLKLKDIIDRYRYISRERNELKRKG